MIAPPAIVSLSPGADQSVDPRAPRKFSKPATIADCCVPRPDLAIAAPTMTDSASSPVTVLDWPPPMKLLVESTPDVPRIVPRNHPPRWSMDRMLRVLTAADHRITSPSGQPPIGVCLSPKRSAGRRARATTPRAFVRRTPGRGGPAGDVCFARPLPCCRTRGRRSPDA